MGWSPSERFSEREPGRRDGIRSYPADSSVWDPGAGVSGPRSLMLDQQVDRQTWPEDDPDQQGTRRCASPTQEFAVRVVAAAAIAWATFCDEPPGT